jgi:pimeloyl-ACP methyl ester carboxylesterase
MVYDGLTVNGLGSSAESWPPPLLEELAKHHKLILVDNRGTGLSDKPDVTYSIQLMTHDAAHVFDASMGGMIAQEFE